MEIKKENNLVLKIGKTQLFAQVVCMIVLFVWVIGLFYLRSRDTLRIESLETQVIANRKIYVYSLEDVLVKTNMIAKKQEFETEILKLNQELIDSEKKIESIRSAKVKADFSEMYMNNLRLKRDELSENYKKSIEEITAKINASLENIAREKDVSAIFLKNTIAVSTPYVEDITDEVVKRIK